MDADVVLSHSTLIDLGIAVYQVGDVYDTDEPGSPYPVENKAKWFVSAPVDSPLAETVLAIPLADTEEIAWELASQHFKPNVQHERSL